MLMGIMLGCHQTAIDAGAGWIVVFLVGIAAGKVGGTLGEGG